MTHNETASPSPTKSAAPLHADVVTTVRAFPRDNNRRSGIYCIINMKYAKTRDTLGRIFDESSTRFQRMTGSHRSARAAALTTWVLVPLLFVALLVNTFVKGPYTVLTFFLALAVLVLVGRWVNESLNNVPQRVMAAKLSGLTPYDITEIPLTHRIDTDSLVNDLNRVVRKLDELPVKESSSLHVMRDTSRYMSKELITMMGHQGAGLESRSIRLRDEKLANALLLLSGMVRHVDSLRCAALCSYAVDGKALESAAGGDKVDTLEEALYALKRLEADIVSMMMS